MKNHTHSHFLIIALMIAMCAGFFIWWSAQHDSKSSNQNTHKSEQGINKLTQDASITWQTFTNEKRDFTISYADFTNDVKKEPDRDVYLFPFGGKDKMYPNEVYLFSVSIDDRDNSLYDTDDYFGTKPEQYTLSQGRQAKIFRIDGAGCTKPVCGSSTLVYRETKGTKDYSIVIAGTISEDHPTAQKILSSFKVLK